MSFWRKTVIQPALDSEEEAAIREQQRLLELDSLNPKPHFALGTMAHFRGRTDEAIQYFLKAIDLDPSYAAPHASLGRIFAVQGELTLAWKHAREAERLGDKSLVEQLERYPAATKPLDQKG
ncbi:MAG: tetratricopeptide repeat protein [Terriglobia bacterium]